MDVVLMIRASLCSPRLARSRQYAAAWRAGAKVPRRWTLITASHSSSVMLTIMRSRRMPALLTRTSRPPNVSTAWWTMRAAPAQSATSSVLATASPPASAIDAATSRAGPPSAPVPSRAPPRSLTTTRAPWAASISAWSRPIPRPAPVTMHTRPSRERPITRSSCGRRASGPSHDLGVVAGPVALLEHALVELAVRVARQLLHEVDALRALVGRQLAPAVLQQLLLQFLARGCSRDQLDDRLHLLAHLRVGNADDGDVGDGGVGGQHVLRLLRVDVDAARDDHVGGPVGEVQVPVGVEVADVADGPPAVAVAHRRRLARVVVVLELPAAREVDGARLPRRELLAVRPDDVALLRGPAHRARVGEPLLGGDPRAADVLGRRVVLLDDGAPPLHHLALDGDGARRGRVHDVAETGDVVAVADLLRELQEADEHGRHHLGVRHAVALDEGEELLGVEALHAHHRRPDPLHRHRVDERGRGVQ